MSYTNKSNCCCLLSFQWRHICNAYCQCVSKCLAHLFFYSRLQFIIKSASYKGHSIVIYQSNMIYFTDSKLLNIKYNLIFGRVKYNHLTYTTAFVLIVDLIEHVSAIHLDLHLRTKQEHSGQFPVQGVYLLRRRAQSVVEYSRHKGLDAARRLLGAKVEFTVTLTGEDFAHYHYRIHVRFFHYLQITIKLLTRFYYSKSLENNSYAQNVSFVFSLFCSVQDQVASNTLDSYPVRNFMSRDICKMAARSPTEAALMISMYWSMNSLEYSRVAPKSNSITCIIFSSFYYIQDV